MSSRDQIASTDARRGICRRLCLALIVTAVLVFPFFSGSTHHTGLALSGTLMFVLVTLGLAAYARAGRMALKFSPVELLGLAVLGVVILSAFQARYAIDAWQFAGGLVLLALSFVVFRAETTDTAGKKVVAAVLVVSGAIQALFGLHQYFRLDWYREALPGYYAEFLAPNITRGALRIVGGFINPNYLAAFLNICLCMVLAALLGRSGGRPFKALLAALAVLFYAALFLTGSKAGMVVSLIALAIVLIARDRRFLWLVLILVALVILAPNPLRERFVQVFQGDQYSDVRPQIWLSSILMAADHPFLGVGPAGYGYTSHRYAPPNDFLPVRYSKVALIAHNSYLHALAELGILGFLPLLAFIGAALAAIVAAVSRFGAGKQPAIQRLGPALGITTVLLHSLFDNIAHNRCILAVSLLLGACLLNQLRDAEFSDAALFGRRLRIPLELPRRLAPLLALVILWLGFYIAHVALPWRYESAMSAAAQRWSGLIGSTGRNASPGSQGHLDYLNNLRILAGDLEAMTDLYPANTALRRYLGAVNRELYRHSGDPKHFDAALHNYRAAEASQPGQGRDAYSQLSLYIELKNHGYPKTQEILGIMESLARRAHSQWPHRAVYLQLAAVIQREEGDLAAAAGLLEQAIALEPNYRQAIADLGGVAQAMNNEELLERVGSLMRQANARIRKYIEDAERRGIEPDLNDYARTILGLS